MKVRNITLFTFLTVFAITVKSETIVLSNNLCIGSTEQLSPSSGGSWSSSDPTVATVSSSGLVTAINSGTVNFTFQDLSTGSSTTTPDYIINASPLVFVSTSLLCIGETDYASPSSGGTWTSSDESIATITNAGEITGVSAGSVTFTFTDETTGCSETTDPMTINGGPSVSISGSDEICIGSTTSLMPNSGGTWTSSDASVATVTNSGIVTGVSLGTVTFTFISSATGCESVTSAISVTDEPTVSIASSALCEGTTTTVTSGIDGIWTSSDPSVATVSFTGEVTAIASGTAMLTFVGIEGCEAEPIEVTVNDNPLVLVSTSSLCIGESDNAIPTSGGTWTSSDANIATITNAGEITGVSAGTVTFTFTDATTGCSETTDPMTINGEPAVSISGNDEICIGSTTTLMPNSGGTWTSSDASVATVTNSGIVTGVSLGTVTFTFISSATGCESVTSAISVTDGPTVSIASSTLCLGSTTTVTSGVDGIWTSSDPSVATVSFTGEVTAIASGATMLTFVGVEGCEAEPIEVTVSGDPVVALLSSELCIGESDNAIPSSGGTWTSSDANIATITNSGEITGVSAGTVTFTFTDATTGCSETTSTMTINGGPIVNINDSFLCPDETTNLIPNSGGTWVSSNPLIATVSSNGIVNAIAGGTVRFIYTDSNTGCSNETEDLNVTSRPDATLTGPSEILVNEVSKVESTHSIGVWTTSDPTVATVSNSGDVLGIASGIVSFTYTSAVTGCTSLPTADLTVIEANEYNGIDQNWNNPSNWSMGYVPANPLIQPLKIMESVDFTSSNGLEVTTGGQLIIDFGVVLSVSNRLKISGTGKVVNNGGAINIEN